MVRWAESLHSQVVEVVAGKLIMVTVVVASYKQWIPCKDLCYVLL